MTAKKPKDPPTELGIYADQMREAITLVKPFIGIDDTLPMLCGYRLAVIGGDLYVSGTDRYTLAVARVAPKDEQTFPAGFVGFLPQKLAARALMLFGGRRPKGVPPVRLRVSISGQWATVENDPGSDEPPTRMVAEVLSTCQPPNLLDHVSLLRKVIGEWRDSTKREDGIPVLGINPAFTARLAVVQKILGKYQYVTARITAHNKPILFTAGGDFLALQMPARIPDEEAAGLDVWAERFAEPKPAARPRARKAPAKKAAPKKAAPRKAKSA